MSKDYDERSNFKDENPLAWLAPNYLNNSGLHKVRAPFGEHELFIKHCSPKL